VDSVPLEELERCWQAAKAQEEPEQGWR
jgi:hypothetical protein